MANKVRLRVGRPVSYLTMVGGICKWLPARVVSIIDATHVTLKTDQGVTLNSGASTVKHTGAVNSWRPY